MSISHEFIDFLCKLKHHNQISFLKKGHMVYLNNNRFTNLEPVPRCTTHFHNCRQMVEEHWGQVLPTKHFSKDAKRYVSDI